MPFCRSAKICASGGEATSVEHAATVFGAYASGKVAAGQIESSLGA
jgi:hypothetical protein